MKIFDFNEKSESHETDTAEEQEMSVDEIDSEFPNFTRLYQTTSLKDFLKVE